MAGNVMGNCGLLHWQLLTCWRSNRMQHSLLNAVQGHLCAGTGAIAQRMGRFELADRGTIFLDEIGEIPLELQPKLLRVLQEREFERLGSYKTLKTNARLIAATNRDLGALAREQEFRSDFFTGYILFPSTSRHSGNGMRTSRCWYSISSNPSPSA